MPFSRLGKAYIKPQKAPDQDLAQNGRFPRIPEGEFHCRPRGLQMPELCSKRLLTRIWPKTAISQGSQKGSLIAGRGAAKCKKFASKRLLARIWPKTAVSQGSQKGSLIAGRGAAKGQTFASKRLLARIWPQTAVSQGSEKGLRRTHPTRPRRGGHQTGG